MKRFEGKKLLLLGSNVGTLDLIRYAKANGAFTVVADNLPVEKSFGKQYSDDNVLISTGDLDQLKEYIIKKGIHGVFAGVSEFNLLNAMTLCNYFGFPFYCSRFQWDLIENKENFRHLCQQYRVPSPRTYFCGCEINEEIVNSIEYPVIVKPVDSSASIGITICKNRDTLMHAIPDALNHSDKGRIIIEEFFEGEEFSAHYTIANGKVTLSCVDNRIPVAVNEGDVTTIPLARVYPSTFIQEYISQINTNMISLIESLHLETGVLFIQGLYNKENQIFSIFEAGLRCAGEGPYRFIERVNGVSFMNIFVDHALTGHSISFDSSKEDPFLKGKTCCITSFVSKGGKVGSICNFNETVARIPSIVDSECRYHEGDTTPNGNTLRQIMLRFALVCDSREQLIEDVEMINNNIEVTDEQGRPMCCTFNIRNYFSNI